MEARKQLGPSGGRRSSGSNSWRARLEESSALIAPLALIGGLTLAGGGYELGPRHLAGLAVWLVIVALLAFGAASRATLGRPFYLAAGSIGCLALLSALSSLWSGSIELSVIEADRVLVYLSFFLAAFLIAQTIQRRQRFAEGLAISLALVALLALGARLLPDLFGVSLAGAGSRVRYPLGYWNANGIVFAIGTALLLWMSRRSSWGGLRWAAAALLPVLLVALYMTYSRGGLLSLLVACGCLIALSRDRLWLFGTLAIGALAAVPAVLAVQAHRSLAENIPNQAAIDQGVTVCLYLLGCIGLSLLLFAGLRRLEAGQGRLTGRALALSREPRILRALALVAALLALGAAVAVGGRAWDQFSTSEAFPTNPEKHFGEFTSGGRHDFWQVAIDSFEEKPLLGHGAGTYEFSWTQLRPTVQKVRDAHSLYLEAFAELGLVGGLLVLGLVGTVLWVGFGAWRNASGAQRELCAALLAACLAFAVGAAIDWFWEIAAVGAVFFLAAGALVAVRCGQLGRERPGQRSFGFAVVGIAVAWIAAVALIGPLLVDREIEASQRDAAAGNVSGAIDHAETARSIEPWAASPYVQLGLLATELQGDYPTAIERLGEAIEREDRNWQLYYLRAGVEREAGRDAAAQADLERARQLDPREPLLGASSE
jgi:O-antigen ligase